MDWHWLTAIAGDGYAALFLLAFLAATLLPLGSEWLLVSLLLAGGNPPALVAVATAGNLLGSLFTWVIGRYGGPFFVQRLLRIDEAARRRGQERFERYGSWTLLLAWVPVIGDPLCLVAGAMGVRIGRFLLLVALGKFGRYAVLAWLTLASRQL